MGDHFPLPFSSLQWDLNRFVSDKGGGLHILSLDWEGHNTGEDIHPHTKEAYFGPAAHITNLDGLNSLKHLTISLQALFGDADTFEQWDQEVEASMECELTKLLPPSLRVQRIPSMYQVCTRLDGHWLEQERGHPYAL